ncbi:MAG: amino acid adenylation domain-containing protein [Alphaproteobacteria bacterium]|nr:amino acid adenylation domain-containing protein [Alphaproteobacteria bacterium]MBU1514145.1 amino acid adenylation domain-containing protein [Alphaproteobacteria bacterium]MBU2096206.1 amino acid adenylation domain-containing protein [Alphaproteobacteria bacterium]MBU2151160.1 amino acid adenylation domain-containing protein [Alphaproteobacteria bacterium]MBU2307181.1 amino acid adenylation domain-containing protein [Alphaproteobacteria bacterium]
MAPNEERYVLDALAPDVFGNPWTVRITGRLDVGRFKDAIRQSCQRHEMRRARYEAGPDGVFTRIVEPRARFGFVEHDMPNASADAIRVVVNDWYFQRLDLTPLTLTRFLVIHLGPEETILGYSFHHGTADGEAKDAFMAEILGRYSGETEFPPAVPFSEIWNWDWAGSDGYRAAEAFWAEKLRDTGSIGGLPADRAMEKRADIPEPVSVRLPPDLVANAKAAAVRAGVSEFTFYYAVCLVLLTRLVGDTRVATTFQSGGRRGVPGAQGVHGCFSNGLILATAVDEDESVKTLAGRLRTEIREALANELVPYHHVIRLTGVSPRFGVNWFPEQETPQAKGVVISRPDMTSARYDYDANLRFVHDDAGAIDLIIFSRESTLGPERILAVAQQFARLLEAFAADEEAPIRAVRSAALAPAGLLPDPMAALSRDAGEPTFAAFLRKARETPDAPAVIAADTWTYAELEGRSRALAGRLRAAGVSSGERVAILAERSADLVCAMLAVARAGGAFALLDATHPEPRLMQLLEICAPRVVLAAGADGVRDLAARLAEAHGLPLLTADDAAADPTVADLDQAASGDLAYILFTSGSTGQPKAIACNHLPLTHFLRWQADTFGLSADDRFTQLAGVGHDPMLRDVFAALSNGAAVLIPEAAVIAEPGALANWMRERGATVAHLTPAMGKVLLAGAAGAGGFPDLRRVFWGGDRLPPALVAEVAAVAPRAEQINVYGSTETPQAAAWWRCDDDLPWGAVPIGKGIEGFQLLVLNAQGDPVGVGEAGEIAVRSHYLSLGYVQAGRIAPLGDTPAEGGEPGVYRTGDRGFYLPDGSVYFLGRADDQVKVRGYRVELAEVTAALTACAGVEAAIALLVDAEAGPAIIGFVAPRAGASPHEAALLREVGERLPGPMSPVAVHVLAALPLLPSGKVDRKALEALGARRDKGPVVADLSGANTVERALIDRWTGVLGDAGISRATTFAGLGGDSLSYVQAYLATEEVIGVVPSGWQAMTIAELCAARRTANRFWSVVDTPMLVRAISIVVVVMGHLGALTYGGGATVGLMIVFGFMFGAFQLSETFAGRTAEPILKGLRRLLLPVMLFSVMLFTVKSVMGKSPDLSVLLLYGNFVDYSKLSGPHWGGHEFYLWFIYSSIQMMTLIWLAALAALRFGAARMTAARFALGMFAVGCVTRFVAPAFFIPDFFSKGAPEFTAVNYLPTTHLSTVMLGALIAMAQTRRARLGVLALLIAYAALTAPLYSPAGALVVLGAGVLILAVKRLPLPRPLTALVLTLSGASLFIYLTHFQFRGVLRALGAPELPLLDVGVALLGGVAAWAVWIRVSAFVARLLRRTPTTEPQAVL